MSHKKLGHNVDPPALGVVAKTAVSMEFPPSVLSVTINRSTAHQIEVARIQSRHQKSATATPRHPWSSPFRPVCMPRVARTSVPSVFWCNLFSYWLPCRLIGLVAAVVSTPAHHPGQQSIVFSPAKDGEVTAVTILG